MAPTLFDTPGRREYTVSTLTHEIGLLLEDAYRGIWVRGEVSGLKVAASGHAYLTLKDDSATLRAACWKGAWRLLRYKPRDGDEVLVRGRIEVYAPRGEYQLIVDEIHPAGLGALQAAFEAMKQRLAAEGLFAEERKRPLPPLPQRIGVVTSPTGAVIRDILHVIERRFPGLHIRIFPARVQGPSAAGEIAAGLDYFSREPWADLVILARGGGSLEDLWAFNEEEVARAIARCAVPVVSAVGHETDFTIADFVADLRAPTPSAAAEIITASRAALLDHLAAAHARLAQAIHLRLSRAGRRLGQFDSVRARALVERRLFQSGRRLDDAAQTLRSAVFRRLESARSRSQNLELRLRRLDLRIRLGQAKLRRAQAHARLEAAAARLLQFRASILDRHASRLEAMNPLAILERGFAVVSLPSGVVLRNPADAPPGTRLRLRLHQGELPAEALSPDQDPI